MLCHTLDVSSHYDIRIFFSFLFRFYFIIFSFVFGRVIVCVRVCVCAYCQNDSWYAWVNSLTANSCFLFWHWIFVYLDCELYSVNNKFESSFWFFLLIIFNFFALFDQPQKKCSAAQIKWNPNFIFCEHSFMYKFECFDTLLMLCLVHLNIESVGSDRDEGAWTAYDL